MTGSRGSRFRSIKLACGIQIISLLTGSCAAFTGPTKYNLQDVTISENGIALQAVTVTSWSTGGFDERNRALRFLWDFGDGTTASQRETTHVFMTAGTFTVTLTLSDDNSSATAKTAVIVEPLTGTWLTYFTPGEAVPTYAWTLNLVQTGTTLSGTARPRNLTVGNIVGDVSSTAPHVRFSVLGGGVPNAAFTLNAVLGKPLIMQGTWTGLDFERSIFLAK